MEDSENRPGDLDEKKVIGETSLRKGLIYEHRIFSVDFDRKDFQGNKVEDSKNIIMLTAETEDAVYVAFRVYSSRTWVPFPELAEVLGPRNPAMNIEFDFFIEAGSLGEAFRNIVKAEEKRWNEPDLEEQRQNARKQLEPQFAPFLKKIQLASSTELKKLDEIAEKNKKQGGDGRITLV